MRSTVRPLISYWDVQKKIDAAEALRLDQVERGREQEQQVVVEMQSKNQPEIQDFQASDLNEIQQNNGIEDIQKDMHHVDVPIEMEVIASPKSDQDDVREPLPRGGVPLGVGMGFQQPSGTPQRLAQQTSNPPNRYSAPSPAAPYPALTAPSLSLLLLLVGVLYWMAGEGASILRGGEVSPPFKKNCIPPHGLASPQTALVRRMELGRAERWIFLTGSCSTGPTTRAQR